MGKYVEDEDFVPNPTDLRGTFETTRTGVPQNPDAMSDVFAKDRYEAAKRADEAIDGNGEPLLVSDEGNREDEEAAVKDAISDTLDAGEPEPGDPTRAQKEAAEEGDADAAAAANSADEQPDISDATTQQNKDTQNIAKSTTKRTRAKAGEKKD